MVTQFCTTSINIVYMYIYIKGVKEHPTVGINYKLDN